MKDIKKLDDTKIECDREDCQNYATVKIKESSGTPLRLCPKHRRKFEEKIREKIKDKFEGMSKEQIARKIVQEGEGIL